MTTTWELSFAGAEETTFLAPPSMMAFLGEEDAGRLADVVSAEGAPPGLVGVTAADGVVLVLVGHAVGGGRPGVGGIELDVAVLHHDTVDETADARSAHPRETLGPHRGHNRAAIRRPLAPSAACPTRRLPHPARLLCRRRNIPPATHPLDTLRPLLVQPPACHLSCPPLAVPRTPVVPPPRHPARSSQQPRPRRSLTLRHGGQSSWSRQRGRQAEEHVRIDGSATRVVNDETTSSSRVGCCGGGVDDGSDGGNRGMVVRPQWSRC